MTPDWSFPYPSQRMPVLADNVVATSQPLAAQAGLAMLARGGNAADAAVAAAIALTVVEPTSNGIGGDAFALLWDGGRLHGLNGSGRSPAAWTPARFAGRERMPDKGWDCVTVPGAPAAWASLAERFGKLPFADLFEPAVRYAADGFPVSPITAAAWARGADLFGDFPAFCETFLPGGRAPTPGERFRFPDAAETLAILARTRCGDFYRGELADRIASEASASGAALTAADLASHRSEWVEPLAVDFAGVTLHELPPNGQGIAALIALSILDRLGADAHPPDSPDRVHLQLEAMKLALHDAYRHVADPAHMTVEPADLLDERRIDRRASLVRPDRAMALEGLERGDGGTVYLTAADASGMMVSFIQSNFYGFGSGVVVPGTGISLQSRGMGFTLEEGHPNRVGGGKRPYHTILPGFVTREGSPLMSFGVMGGNMQPQGHVQMVFRVFADGLNPQAASDAPRWYVHEDFRVSLEPGFHPSVAEDLKRRGHVFAEGLRPSGFGGAQLILNLDGGWCAASDSRKDGQAVGF